LLAGNIQAIAATPDFGLIAEGKARLIGSTGTRRWPQAPDVPTFAEAGYPDLIASISWGFAAPAGTPDDVINVLNAAVNQALLTDRVKQTMVDNAYFVTGGPPDVLWSALRQQISGFENMVRAGTINFE
jgi:tripartite-type tricarboxylate transporter receptor subunit TctC